MPPDHWFEELADHLGAAYLRYSFTKGTTQEVDFLIDVLQLEMGQRVLDVGCGPGRHAHELARRGIEVLGVDISDRFVELARRDAPTGAAFERLDARRLDEATHLHGCFDAVISLCQGAYGLGGPGPFDGDPFNLDHDTSVLAGMASALRPGGRAAVSAFSAYFQLRWLEDTDRFDAATAVNHEITEVRDSGGVPMGADLWTTCTTPRELRLLMERAGLVVCDIWSVAPGSYAANPPTIDLPEFLAIATSG